METVQRRQAVSKLNRIPGYAGGGFLDKVKSAVGMQTSKQVMDAKVAAEMKKMAEPAPAASQPAPAAPINNISGYVGNSTLAAREKAAGLAKGGEIKTGMAKAAMAGQGGKLKGPGTATSDDIPAEVVDTGEPIRVATGERIVSKKQDKFLQEVAKERGFPSVDAMFEAETGVPVGPTLKYSGDAASGKEPMQHASLGGMFDAAKRAVGITPESPEMKAYKAKAAAERAAAKNQAPAAPASSPAPGVAGGLDGSGGNSLARREKEAGLARGGALKKNMAQQKLGTLRTTQKKNELNGEVESFSGGGLMGVIEPAPSIGFGNRPIPKRSLGQTDEDVARAKAEAAARQSKAEARAETARLEAREDIHRSEDRIERYKMRGIRGYAGGGIMGTIEANAKNGFGGIPVVGPKLGSSSYANGGLMGAIEKEVSSYIKGTPSYSGGGLMGTIEANPNLGWKGVSSFSGGGVPSPGDGQMPYGEQMRNLGEAMVSIPATALKTLVSAPGYGFNAPSAAPVAPAPVAQAPAPTPAAAPAPAAPSAAARLSTAEGVNVGGGATRFNTPGKSPLFTNVTDAAGMASNEALNNRGPVTAQNIGAMDGIQARQDAADTARARKAQYDAEVAGAQAINNAAPAFDPEAGARALTDFRSPTSRALASLSTRDKNGKLAPGAEKMMAEIYKQTLGGPQTAYVEDQRNATTRRGQDLGAQATNAQTQIQRQRLGLETSQDQRSAKQAERAERAQRRIESLYDDYANADDKDKPKLAEQLRVMTGKDKPEQWQAIALQGSTDAMGNKTEGVLAAVNKSTGEMRKLDQGGSGGAGASNAPVTKAEYDKLPKGAKYTHPDGSTRTKG